MLDAMGRYQQKLRWLKRWIWLYFFLLIFEGALRKWLLPSLSGPLLLIRDPVALIIYGQAYRCHKLSMKTMQPLALLATVLSLLAFAQVAEGVNTFTIAIYGLRAYLLHLPLIFVIADTLDMEDLVKLGRWLLLLSIPMAVLIFAQYKAPGNAWLNAGAGENSGQIISARGHIRPAGTFSYGIGMQGFTLLVGAFLIDALTRRSTYPRWLVYAALFSTIACIPMLGSRSTLFAMVLLCMFALFTGASSPARMGGIIKLVVVVLLAGGLAIQLPFFNDAVETFQARWQQASQLEGDVQHVFMSRLLAPLESSVGASGSTPLLGEGIGMGSNYAAVEMTGEQTFLLGESEYERIMLEMGPLFGLLFLGLRIAFVVYLFLQARRALRYNSVLAWLLVPTAAPLVLAGAMEQTTFLGFMIVGSGLCLAAVNSGIASRGSGMAATL